MDEETEEVVPALEEEEELELDTTPEDDDQEEDVETLKAEKAKAEELANNYKIRAEKAEKLAKEGKAPKPASTDLSSIDLYALMDAKVPQDDIQEVTEYAKLKKISVQEALKSTVVKSILADNAEKRRTAEVTNTGATRRAGGKVTSDNLLAKARKGEMPESDEDIARLVNARLGIKD